MTHRLSNRLSALLSVSSYWGGRMGAFLFLFLLPFFVGAETIKFVFVSDCHYGLSRTFRGQEGVSAQAVSRAMIEKINLLPGSVLPNDGGVCGGQKVGVIDFVANTGDIANRMEPGIQIAAYSWEQFLGDWTTLLDVKCDGGKKAPLYLLPGNHDATNAIGWCKPMHPDRDATAMAEIFNLMMKPKVARTAESFDYQEDKVQYSFTLKGVHFVFAGIWPDTPTRRWIETDMAQAGAQLPVILFVHDQPDVEAKHFINPNGKHDLNPEDRFENLLADTSSVRNRKDVPVKERAQLADFLAKNRQIKAYFHGNENYNEFYRWPEGGQKESTPIFRVDSPMKGVYSSADESLLSFIFVCIDTDAHKLTARECLWNAGKGLSWGEHATIAF